METRAGYDAGGPGGVGQPALLTAGELDALQWRIVAAHASLLAVPTREDRRYARVMRHDVPALLLHVAAQDARIAALEAAVAAGRVLADKAIDMWTPSGTWPGTTYRALDAFYAASAASGAPAHPMPAQDARIAALEAAQGDVRGVLRRYAFGTAAWHPTAAQSGTAVDIAYHLRIDLREGD